VLISRGTKGWLGASYARVDAEIAPDCSVRWNGRRAQHSSVRQSEECGVALDAAGPADECHEKLKTGERRIHCAARNDMASSRVLGKFKPRSPIP